MPHRPVVRIRMLAAVVAGGVIGVAARELVLLPFPPEEPGSPALPVATLAVNVVGSFALGLVVGWLGNERPLLRAFLGAGVLGGLTTYSSFAVQTAVLVGLFPVAGVLLAVVSVAAGLAAAATGLHVTGRPRHRPGAADPEATS